MSRNSAPKRSPAASPGQSVPSRSKSGLPRAAHHPRSRGRRAASAAPSVRTGGIPAIANFIATWFRPHSAQSATSASAKRRRSSARGRGKGRGTPAPARLRHASPVRSSKPSTAQLCAMCGGSGALTSSVPPSGCGMTMRRARRCSRFWMPPGSSQFSTLKYFGSPTIGWPIWAAWARSWWVRPVIGRIDQPGQLLPRLVGDARKGRRRARPRARRACDLHALAFRALAAARGRWRRGPRAGAARRRRAPSRASGSPAPRTPGRERRRLSACAATTSTPAVSRSSRWTRRGLRPCRSVKASSMASTCRVTPEPPCTARPAGLLKTSTCASSCRSMAASASSSAAVSRAGAG